MATTGAKQRLVQIDVAEVSLVDHPANLQPFVVTKRNQGDKETVVAKADETVGLDPYTASKVTLDAARDLIWRLSDKLGDPSKIGDAKAELERIKAMLDQAQQFSNMISKAIGDISAVVLKAKTDGDDKKDGKKVPAFMREEMKKLIDTVKAMMDDGDGDEDTSKALEVITKAGKAQFSKERMAKLAEAFKHMGALYKEADADGFTKAMDEWTAKPATAQSGGSANDPSNGTTGPNTTQPKPVTEGNSANKSADGGAPQWFDKAIEGMQANITKQIDAIKGDVGKVSKRVEAVEAVEAVSKALPQVTDDKTKPVKKGDSIWKGVL